MKQALFLCTGNTCRSPMAACLFTQLCRERGLSWLGESAGLYAMDGSTATQGAREAMKARGLSLSDHTAKPVTRRLIEQSDLIVCLSQEHERLLRERFGEFATPVTVFSPPVPDPYGGDLARYEQAARLIERGLHDIVHDVEEK